MRAGLCSNKTLFKNWLAMVGPNYSLPIPAFNPHSFWENHPLIWYEYVPEGLWHPNLTSLLSLSPSQWHLSTSGSTHLFIACFLPYIPTCTHAHTHTHTHSCIHTGTLSCFPSWSISVKFISSYPVAKSYHVSLFLNAVYVSRQQDPIFLS